MNTYTPKPQFDLEDLSIVVMIEWDTAQSIRINPRDYHRLGHPTGSISFCGHWLPVIPACDVPHGAIDAQPIEYAEPAKARLSRLLTFIITLFRRTKP